MGIGDRGKFPGHGGEQVSALAGHDHGAAGTEAQHGRCLLDQLHSPANLVQVHQLRGLVDSIDGKPSGFLYTPGKGVRGHRLAAAADPQHGMSGQLDLEGIETL